jgi:hypothetical protein
MGQNLPPGYTTKRFPTRGRAGYRLPVPEQSARMRRRSVRCSERLSSRNASSSSGSTQPAPQHVQVAIDPDHAALAVDALPEGPDPVPHLLGTVLGHAPVARNVHGPGRSVEARRQADRNRAFARTAERAMAGGPPSSMGSTPSSPRAMLRLQPVFPGVDSESQPLSPNPGGGNLLESSNRRRG